VSIRSVQLSTASASGWNAPANNRGHPVIEYTTTAKPASASCTWATGARTCTITGLANGTSNASAAAAATPRTVPGAPSVVGVTPGDRSAVVTWSPPAGNGGVAISSYTATASPGGATAVRALPHPRAPSPDWPTVPPTASALRTPHAQGLPLMSPAPCAHTGLPVPDRRVGHGRPPLGDGDLRASHLQRWVAHHRLHRPLHLHQRRCCRYPLGHSALDHRHRPDPWPALHLRGASHERSRPRPVLGTFPRGGAPVVVAANAAALLTSMFTSDASGQSAESFVEASGRSNGWQWADAFAELRP
jgi:hypothetical protein